MGATPPPRGDMPFAFCDLTFCGKARLKDLDILPDSEITAIKQMPMQVLSEQQTPQLGKGPMGMF